MRSIDEADDEPPIIYTPPSRLSKSTRAIGWVIFMLALLARAACLKQLQGSPIWAEMPVDVAYYIDWAKRMAAGDWIGTGVFERSPLYAYFLGIVFKLLDTGLLAPRLIQIVLGSATCVLIHRIGRQAFSPLTGLAAGLTAAVYAPFLLHDVMLDREIFAVFFICAIVYQLLAADGSQRGLLATAGVCLGLAALVRDALILMAPVTALWLMIDPWLRGKMTRGRTREGLGRVGSLAIGLMLVLIPVAVRNYNVSGETVLLTTESGELVAIGDNPQPLSHRLVVFLNGRELPDDVDYFRHRSLLPVLRLPLPTWGWAAPAALAGMILSLTRWREALVLYFIGGGYIATALLFNLDRYRMPVVPLMILFAAYGVVELVTAVARRRFVRAALGALALFAGIAVVNWNL